MGKFNTVKDGINQLHFFNILDVSELKWARMDFFQSEDHTEECYLFHFKKEHSKTSIDMSTQF